LQALHHGSLVVVGVKHGMRVTQLPHDLPGSVSHPTSVRDRESPRALRPIVLHVSLRCGRANGLGM